MEKTKRKECLRALVAITKETNTICPVSRFKKNKPKSLTKNKEERLNKGMKICFLIISSTEK